MSSFISPSFGLKAYNCPHCGAFAVQYWAYHVCGVTEKGQNIDMNEAVFARCSCCNSITVWINERMIYPISGRMPLPNPDMPSGIREDYIEAREIAALSPRGAAALLRLTIQKLCAFLGEKGKNINDDIASLVKKGLPSEAQRALDIVRVIGNDAVHPGQIDMNEDPKSVVALFELVNIIVEKMISEPVKIQKLFEGLPESRKKEIAKRDGTG